MASSHAWTIKREAGLIKSYPFHFSVRSMPEEYEPKSSEVNLRPPSEFTLENLRDKPLIADKSNQTSATFDYNLADSLWYRINGRIGKQITFYVDRGKNIGDMKVSRRELKHIKRQLKEIETNLDPVTGNAFDLRVTADKKNASKTDIRIFKTKNMRKYYGHDSTGIWETVDLDLTYQHNQRGGKNQRNRDLIKETLSHEIGHIFGLEHPLDSLEERKYFSDTIMNCCEGHTGTFLTNGDLDLLAYGWKHTFDHMYQNLA